MKLLATIDYWDDKPGKVIAVYPESLTNLSMYFSSGDVASITITRPPDLVKMARGEQQ